MENKLAIFLGVFIFLVLYSNKPSLSVCDGSSFSFKLFSDDSLSQKELLKSINMEASSKDSLKKAAVDFTTDNYGYRPLVTR